ncbi:hypothetical protein [Psychroflexus sp. MBR-150]|jgi:hypothetical protein
MNLKAIFFLLLFFGFYSSIFAQVKEEQQDSSMYQNIEKYSKKTKSTKFLHKLIFKPTTKRRSNQTTQNEKENYANYEGKIIRKITIETHDPFGYSFKDSIQTDNTWLEKTGNNMHVKSKQGTINDLLLIKEKIPLDIIKLKESERLVRAQNYIRNVEITIKNSANSKDSIDVFVDVLDSWSLIPSVSLSTDKNKIRLKERNFLGLGHEFNNQYSHRMSDSKSGYDIRYTVPNFKNSYINTSIGYNIDLDDYYGKFFDVSRRFYSPLTKWAGGIYLDEQFRHAPFIEEDSITNTNSQNIKYQSLDVWGGYSFQIFKGSSVRERTTNLITSGRLLRLDYKQGPTVEFDSIGYFSDETFALSTIGVSSRQFVQDAYIFRDGIIEDVPIGTIYATTFGYQRKYESDRLYLGAKISHGRYFNWGYLSTSFEYGTFVKKQQTEQTAYSFQANYFTNLISLGENWKMRQFIKPQVLIGINRLNSIGDRLTIDEYNPYQDVYGDQAQRKNNAGIPGFSSNLVGTKKIVLSLQTQFYSPWAVLGFRFNPFVNITTALLGNEDVSITKSRLYSAFRVGFVIRNDFLVFNSFQLSFSYYPIIPGKGNHIFNTNSFDTEDFGFQNFELGKPTPIWYN